MTTFFITGGAGFIGSHIARKILENRMGEVVIFDNLAVGKTKNIPKNCQLIQGDIRDTKALSDAMKDVDVVFHNAAYVSIRGSFEKLGEDISTNCLGTLNVLQSAVKSGAGKIVFASSMATYGEPQCLPVNEKHPLLPISPYGLSKTRGELYCTLFEEEFGIKAVILRYFNTYGPRQTRSPYVGVITTFINQALDEQPLSIYGTGEQTRDFVWVEDVADANLLAATRNVTGAFNVGSGVETSINEVADLVIKEIGGKKIHCEGPRGEVNRIVADISKARSELGYEPKGDLSNLILQIIEWWRSETEA